MRPLTPVVIFVAVMTMACGDDAAVDDSDAAARRSDSTSVPDGTGEPAIDPGDDGDYAVDIDPTRFSSVVDNPFMPWLPATRWVYEERTSDGEVEIITVEVLDETRVAMGVETIVVHDTVETDDGELVEDTFDWYAQDDDGNVWYFGEDTKAYEDGAISEAGAWEAGVDGALPGIVMPATPAVSETGYRQEYLSGEAEDMGQIIDTGSGFVVTRDWTPLEPDVIEQKTYVTGVGFVYEWKVSGEGTGDQAVLIELSTR